jgi:Cu/Ag efflux protein CusF
MFTWLKKWVAPVAVCGVALAGVMAVPAHAGPPWIAGKVVKVEPEKSRVVLDHQRIELVKMDAMVMPFKVLPGVKLDGFKPGDKVRFMVELQNDHLVIDALEKTP